MARVFMISSAHRMRDEIGKLAKLVAVARHVKRRAPAARLVDDAVRTT